MEESVEIWPGITVSKSVRFGKPVVKGTRIDIATVMNQLAAGDSFEDLEEGYGLTREQVLAVLSYAADIITHEVVRAY